MAKDHPGNGTWSVNYDVFNCNNGIAPQSGMLWNKDFGTWEWDDLNINSDSIPDNLPQEIKDAIANNICVVCGKKNCPYIREDKGYQQFIDALKKGDKKTATNIYKTKFAAIHNGKEARIAETMNRMRATKAAGGAMCQPSGGGQNHSESTQGWAPPLTWGPWVDLASHAGSDAYTVGFDTESQAPSSFSVQIEYATNSEMKRVDTIGPGSYQIKDNNGAGTDRIRFKSHSLGQNIRVNY